MKKKSTRESARREEGGGGREKFTHRPKQVETIDRKKEESKAEGTKKR